MLRNDGDDFRVPQQNLAHFSRRSFAIFERKRGGHGGANPEVTFFQVGKKLTAEAWRDQKKCSKRDCQFDSDHKSAVS